MGIAPKIDTIVVVTGHAASGKTVFCQHLAGNIGGDVRIINVGSILAKKLTAEGIEVAYKAQIGQVFLEKYGEQAIAAVLEAELKAKCGQDRNIIIDGIRLRSTMEFIKSAYRGRIVHIHLSTSRAILKERVRKLRSKDERALFKDYMKAEKRYNHDMRLFGKMADYMVIGDDVTERATNIAQHLQINNKLADAA